MKSKRLDSVWVMFSRSRMYVSIAQFLMIGYIFVNDNSIPDYAVFLMVAALCAITLLDWKYVMPSEYRKNWEKNPVNIEILEILKRLDKISKKEE